VAFIAAILPQRYHSIRSIYIINHSDNQRGRWGSKADYRNFWGRRVNVRNSELQSVRYSRNPFFADIPPRVEPFRHDWNVRLYNWEHTFQLVAAMEGIKKFCWDTSLDSHPRHPSQTYDIIVADFWKQLRRFSEIRDWRGGFEVCVNDSAERIPRHPVWERKNLGFVRVRINEDRMCER
jgi:hypothetical protein